MLQLAVQWYWLLDLPAWAGILASCEALARNYWMHLNVTWPSRWLEWLIVTPRYHHIHHSDDPAHFDTNFGSLFSFWDRLFGTYYDPEHADAARLRFGVNDTTNPLRLAAGV
jgi:sterol desaturase/sphingolipid hydroxylase (fatty acid hydroxylase superfamily)